MNSKAPILWVRRAMAGFALLAFVTIGCATQPETPFDDDDDDPWRPAQGVAQALFGSGQNNAVTQGNARKAEQALHRMEELECPVDEDLQREVREQAEPVADLARESGDILANVQETMGHANVAARLSGTAAQRRDRNRDSFASAQSHLHQISQVQKCPPNRDCWTDHDDIPRHMAVGDVWTAAEDQINALRLFARDMLRAVEDLRTAMESEEAAALIAEWGDPDVDLDSMLAEAQSDAEALNDEWLRLVAIEVDLPTDRSTAVGDMGSSERIALQEHVGSLEAAGTRAYALSGDLTDIFDQFEAMQERMGDHIRQQTERSAAIANETGRRAAEATRHAWMAVEVCGGEIPAEHEALVRNPFDEYDPLPAWNSTFWDISSPGDVDYEPPP